MSTSWRYFVYLYITLHIFYPSVHLSLYKSVRLYPSTTSTVNGAAISILRDTTVSETKWSMLATDTIGYHMKLSLDSTWAFSSDAVTVLSIAIHSDSPKGRRNGNRDVMVSFSQNRSLHFSTLIQIDEKGGHQVFPGCTKDAPYTLSLCDGDIESLMNEEKGTRKEKAALHNTASNAWQYMGNNRNVSYPLIWTFTNYPSSSSSNGDYVMLKYRDGGTAKADRQCGFTAMAPDVAMDILIAAEDQGEDFDILSFDITWQMDTDSPSLSPSRTPSTFPTVSPSDLPSPSPSNVPSKSPSNLPSRSPSDLPSLSPSDVPSYSPSPFPSNFPSRLPSNIPSESPSDIPSTSPSRSPSFAPSNAPSSSPSCAPSAIPTRSPSLSPSHYPSSMPSLSPSSIPSLSPSLIPSVAPSLTPSQSPSLSPSQIPSRSPTFSPSLIPTSSPSLVPTLSPSLIPSQSPSSIPTRTPSLIPSLIPSPSPSSMPSLIPSSIPSSSPSMIPSTTPTLTPSRTPTIMPSPSPSLTPSVTPSHSPSISPSAVPSTTPTLSPSIIPSVSPSTSMPSELPSRSPSRFPTPFPIETQSQMQSSNPTCIPSITPTAIPSSTTNAVNETKEGDQGAFPDVTSTTLDDDDPNFVSPSDVPTLAPLPVISAEVMNPTAVPTPQPTARPLVETTSTSSSTTTTKTEATTTTMVGVPTVTMDIHNDSDVSIDNGIDPESVMTTTTTATITTMTTTSTTNLFEITATISTANGTIVIYEEITSAPSKNTHLLLVVVSVWCCICCLCTIYFATVLRSYNTMPTNKVSLSFTTVTNATHPSGHTLATNTGISIPTELSPLSKIKSGYSQVSSSPNEHGLDLNDGKSPMFLEKPQYPLSEGSSNLLRYSMTTSVASSMQCLVESDHSDSEVIPNI